MVIVQMLGGLGNQLFQYAAGRAVAHRQNVPLKLDISRFDNYPDYLTKREYRLDRFNIAASIASPAEVVLLTRADKTSLRRRVYKFVQQRLPYHRRDVVVERDLRFDPNVFRVPSRVYLVGYWASEKYFKDIEPLIRDELTVREPQSSENQAISNQIHQVEAVSMHLRRGDFVTDPATHECHGVCSLEYYRAATETLTKTVREPHFFVFSDDMPWVRENLRIDYPATYVTHNSEARDYEDLRLMSHCRHHIIANSTFSWWGAWLCDYPEKIVIAPQEWLSDASWDARDLIPEDWIRL